ncbi:MAG: FecCD family ABC transporter permease [Rhodothermales bacterium]
MRGRVVLSLVGTLLFCLLTVVAGASFGSVSLAFADVFRALATFRPPGADDLVWTIVWQIRMPRIVLAFFVGGGLAIVGVAMQALVRNPLAEPYILGISGGASAGASLFYLGFLPPIIARTVSMPIAAFAGGLASIMLVYAVARSRSHVSVTRLLLAGVAISALMGAITAFVTFASPDPDRLRAVLFWLMGSFSGSRWAMIPLPVVVSVSGLVALLGIARTLDAFLLGEERAWNLGVPVEMLKKFLLVLAALVTGPLVAAVGAIGFVGLIIPHIVRMLIGVSHRALLLVSFILGGTFLIWADTAARSIVPGQELPVGILTALCGVPFFLWLLRDRSYQFG